MVHTFVNMPVERGWTRVGLDCCRACSQGYLFCLLRTFCWKGCFGWGGGGICPLSVMSRLAFFFYRHPKTMGRADSGENNEASGGGSIEGEVSKEAKGGRIFSHVFSFVCRQV